MEDCRKCANLCASRTQIVKPDLPEFECAPSTSAADSRPCRVLVIGEAPGADEDAQGKGFVGRAGRTLHALLEEHGLRRGHDYGCANIVRCRPSENRKPTEIEIGMCLPNLANTIADARPAAVLAVGETATRAITGIRGLSENLRLLRYHNHDPLPAEMLCNLKIRAMWPHGAKLFPMPHTSPLAWNRNATDGRKWSAWGREQVSLLAALLPKG